MSLDRAELDARFRELVAPRVFRRGRSSERPLTLWVGGQPGSGKTFCGQALVRRLGESDLCPVIGDDLRRFHPLFDDLVSSDPLRMPEVTAQASGAWVAACIEHANRERFSIVLEGTWRDPALVASAAQEARRWGRRTHAVVVAVPPLLSRVSALERFYLGGEVSSQMGRWTPLEHHDRAAAMLPGTVAELAADRNVERFTVINRAAEELVSLGWSSLRAARVDAVFDGAFNRDSTPHEAAQVVAMQPMIAAAHERAGIRDSGAVEAQSWLYGVASKLQEQFRSSPRIAGVELRRPAARVMIEELRGRAAVRPTDVLRADRGERSMGVER